MNELSPFFICGDYNHYICFTRIRKSNANLKQQYELSPATDARIKITARASAVKDD